MIRQKYLYILNKYDNQNKKNDNTAGVREVKRLRIKKNHWSLHEKIVNKIIKI